MAATRLPRLRKGFATLGGLLAGQETGILHDPDADAELIDFGGSASGAGRAREGVVSTGAGGIARKERIRLGSAGAARESGLDHRAFTETLAEDCGIG